MGYKRLGDLVPTEGRGRQLADITKTKTTDSGKIQAAVTQEVPNEYRSVLTSKALGLSIAPLVIAAYLIYMGASTNSKFAPDDMSRLPFVVGPIGFGAFIVLALVIGTIQQLRKKLIISRREVIYDCGNSTNNFSSSWSNLAYSPPHPGKKLVRSLLLGDGAKFAQFYDIFVPNFDAMVADLDKRKGHASLSSGRMRMGGDSGRINV